MIRQALAYYRKVQTGNWRRIVLPAKETNADVAYAGLECGSISHHQRCRRVLHQIYNVMDQNSFSNNYVDFSVECSLSSKSQTMDYQVSLPPSTTTCLSFKVHRRQPKLVTPAKPTPRELKPLSDIDDQQGLRFQIPVIFFYRPNLTSNLDPVQVIRRALSEALVYYYPFAGRLREGPNRKLSVDCTGEGALFIEADADVTFAELEEADALLPPFPCLDELLFDVEGSSELLNTPLLLVQVTRLKCGGFIFALRFNHTMTDGAGLSLFLKSLCELACGLHAPSVTPVWDRHLLTASVSARVTHTHREYDANVEPEAVVAGDCLVSRSFFFGADEISAIRRLLPPDLHTPLSKR